MQTVARHNVGLAAEYVGGVSLHVHQFEEAELSLFIIEKQINVGILPGLAARRGAEEVEAFDAEPFQIGFVLLTGLWLHPPSSSHSSKSGRLLPCFSASPYPFGRNYFARLLVDRGVRGR